LDNFNETSYPIELCTDLNEEHEKIIISGFFDKNLEFKRK